MLTGFYILCWIYILCWLLMNTNTNPQCAARLSGAREEYSQWPPLTEIMHVKTSESYQFPFNMLNQFKFVMCRMSNFCI